MADRKNSVSTASATHGVRIVEVGVNLHQFPIEVRSIVEVDGVKVHYAVRGRTVALAMVEFEAALSKAAEIGCEALQVGSINPKAGAIQ